MIEPSCVKPKFVCANAITLRISDTTARCAARLSDMPRTRQHRPRPDGSSPGGRCGAAAGRGVSGGGSSTSRSNATGTEMLTGSLNSSVSTSGNGVNGTRKSCVIHSPPSSWRVLTNAVEEESDTQNWSSSSTSVSIVRVPAKALNAPPMAMTATSTAMTAAFMAVVYARERILNGMGAYPPPYCVGGVVGRLNPSQTMPSPSSSTSSGTR